MRTARILPCLMMAATVFGQSIVTPVFVLKDGEASVSGYLGSERDVLVDGAAEQVVGWMTFQTEGIDPTGIAAATLVIYVKSVEAAGTLDVYALTAPVDAPENNVQLSALPMASSPAVSVALGTADIERMVHIDITQPVIDGAEYGVALRSEDGLVATFDAKEGDLAPVVLLTYDIQSAAAQWHSGSGAPDASLGADGDYYLDSGSGDVYGKASGAWSLVTSIAGPQGPKGDTGEQGLTGPAGADGQDGAPGKSIVWQGSLAVAPDTPDTNWAYHNTTDGNAYIWTGDAWEILVQGQLRLLTLGQMRKVPEATFAMGQTDVAEPVHDVYVGSFWVDTTEVTQADYDAVMSDATHGYSAYTAPSWSAHGSGDSYPAYAVNWYDAILYCNARSKRDGRDTVYRYTSVSGTPGNDCTLEGLVIDFTVNGYRLPTEAEWEYACRAGTTTPYHWGTTNHDAYAWTSSNAENTTHPVAQKLPNRFGLYDMSGNVREWCHDWIHVYTAGAVMNPTGPGTGTTRVTRGGDWWHGLTAAQSAYRMDLPPDSEIDFSMQQTPGFRVVLPAW